MLISDAERVGEERFLEAALLAAAAGLRLIQIREPGWEGARVEGLIRRLLERLRRLPPGQPPLQLLVNRRVELVEELEREGHPVAGVHLGGGEPAAVAAARARVGSKRLVGYSAHGVEELLLAFGHGADYVSYSPIFGAISKRHALPPLGLEALAAACRLAPGPVLALGGITAEHATQLKRAGAAGAGMIGAILDAPEPGAVVARFLSLWEGAARAT